MVLIAAASKRIIPPAIEFGLRFAGPIFFLGLQAMFPFLSLLTNCIIWTFYGILRSDNTVLIPNAIGVLAGASCVGVYQAVTSAVPRNLYALAAAIIGFSTFIYTKGNYQLLGSLGCALAVVLSGSPLATLSTVIREKSTASLPFSTSLATWFNALSWSSYGLLVAHDVMIYGPNLLGFALASIQMSLFLLYGLPPTKATIKPIF